MAVNQSDNVRVMEALEYIDFRPQILLQFLIEFR